MNLTFYRMCRWICWAVLRLGWRFTSIHPENVPADGAVIIACNHVSYLDPAALGSGIHRPVTYLAKKELFDVPVLGPIIAGLGTYRLDREAGGAAAIRAALRVLKDGKCIGIFPEGQRNIRGDAEEKGGAAFLAALSGAPVIPAAIHGSRDAMKFHQIRVIYGEPMRIERKRKADGDDLEKWTLEIMRRIRELEESIR